MKKRNEKTKILNNNLKNQKIHSNKFKNNQKFVYPNKKTLSSIVTNLTLMTLKNKTMNSRMKKTTIAITIVLIKITTLIINKIAIK